MLRICIIGEYSKKFNNSSGNLSFCAEDDATNDDETKQSNTANRKNSQNISKEFRKELMCDITSFCKFAQVSESSFP